MSPPKCDLPELVETQLTIETVDQTPLLRRTDACGRAIHRHNLTEKCGSPNPRRAERGTTPSTRLVQPAGFTPPCWRNIIAVVDNDARVRHAQALLNFCGTWGTPHGMLAPRVRAAGCARCACSTTGKRASLPQFLKNLKETSFEVLSELTHQEMRFRRNTVTSSRN